MARSQNGMTSRTSQLTQAISKILMGASLSAALILSGCGDDQAKREEQALRAQERGAAYLAQGQFRAAVIETRNAIQAMPDSVDAHLLMAHIYNSLGQGELATDSLDTLKDQQDPRVKLALAKGYLLQGKFKSAEAKLATIDTPPAELAQEYAEARGDALLGLRDLDNATQWYQKLVADFPDKAAGHVGLAKVALANKNLEAAQGLVDKALQVEAGSTDALLLQAGIHYQQNNLDLTEEKLSSALATLPQTDTITPLRAQVLQLLVEVLTRQGRSTEALVYSKVLAEANPEAHDLKGRFEKALEAFRTGKLEEAQAGFQEVLEKTPNNDMAATMLGMVYYLQGNLEEAQKYLSESLDPETASAEALQVLAATELKLNQPEKVLELLGRDLSALQDSPQLLGLYGLAATGAGKVNEGIDALQKALAEDPERHALRLALANLLFSAGQPDKALQELVTAHEAAPGDLRFARVLVSHYVQMQALPKAEAVVQTTLVASPDSVDAHLLAAQLALFARRNADARAAIMKAQSLDAKSVNAQMALAMLELVERKPDAAIPLLEAVLKEAPANLQAYRGLLRAHELKQTLPTGVERLEALAAQHETRGEPLAVLADLALRQGQWDDAIEQSGKALQRSPGNRFASQIATSAHLRKALTQVQAGQLDDARQTLMHALASMPNEPTVLAMLTRVELSAGKAEEAEKLIAQIEGSQPGSPLVDELKGDLMLSQQKAAEALNSFRQAWGKAPSDGVAQKLFALLSQQDPSARPALVSEWRKALPRSAGALIGEATLAQEKGDTAASVRAYEEALALAPNNALALNNLAWLYHETKDSRALGLAERAYGIAPGNASIADTYGWILVSEGKREEGLRVLEEAAKLAPDNKDIAEHLAKARNL